jgi:hypothetical protein
MGDILPWIPGNFSEFSYPKNLVNRMKQAAVDAGVYAVMCSYNRVNDVYHLFIFLEARFFLKCVRYACENEQTITNDLKGKMGYQVSQIYIFI